MIASNTDPFDIRLLVAGMEPAASPSPLRALTTRLARGEDTAWQQFHQEYGPRIFRQLLALAQGDATLANEALQQTYLRIAKYARPCDSSEIFAGWLRRVAKTALIDCRRGHLRFWQLRQRYHESAPVADPAADDEERLQVALNEAFNQLEPNDRSLLEAKYFSGLRTQEIADNLSLSGKAVESRLTRARAKLRRELQRRLAQT